MNCPTVRIKVKSTAENPLGVVIINESDFIAGEHELYLEGEKTIVPVQKTEGTPISAPETEGAPGAPKAPWAPKG